MHTNYTKNYKYFFWVSVAQSGRAFDCDSKNIGSNPIRHPKLIPEANSLLAKNPH